MGIGTWCVVARRPRRSRTRKRSRNALGCGARGQGGPGRGLGNGQPVGDAPAQVGDVTDDADGPTAVARLRQGAVRLPRYGEVLAVGVGAPDGRPGRVGIDIPQASKAVRASSLNCIPALPAGRSVGKSVGSLDMSVGMSVGIPLGIPLGRPPDPCGGALGRWLRSTPAASRHVRIAARSGPPLPPFGPTDGPPFGPLLEPSDGATDCSPVADGEDPTGPSEPHADSPRAAHRVTTANAGRFLRRVDLVMGAAFLSGMIVIWR